MASGGYHVIDLDGANFGSGNIKVEGLYERIEASVKKPLLVKNFSISNVEQHASYTMCFSVAVGGGVNAYLLPISFTSSGYRAISVNSNDEVSLSDRPIS